MSHPPEIDRAEKAATTNSDQESEVHEVPDGGVRAWCTVLGGFLAMTVVFGYQNAFGVYQDLYVRSHAASSSAVAWIGSTQLTLMVGLSLPCGKLLDMGYFKVTTIAGSLIYVFSLFMLSLAHTNKYYQLFLSQGLTAGIGAGLVYIPILGVQAHHFRRYRPLAMGIVITGSSVGGVIFPIMLNHLFQNPNVGFAWGVRASAFLCLGLLIIANLLMSANPPPVKKVAPPNVISFFSDGPYIVGVLGAMISNWGFFFPYFYLQLFAFTKGVDHDFAFYLLAILNGCSIPGRIVPNIIGQRVGVVNMLVFSSLACAVLVVSFLGAGNSKGAFAALAVLYGFFSGGFISLISPSIASMTEDPSQIGIRLGLAYSIASIAVLTGTPIDGALLGHTFPWWRPIAFSAATLFGGTLTLLACRFLLARKVGSSRV